MTDLTPEEIRALVKDEVDRSTIRDLVAKTIPEKEAGRDWDKIFRHPAVLAILGFVLTTVFAQILQISIENYREENRLRQAEREILARNATEKATEAIALLEKLVLMAHQRATELSQIRFALQDGQKEHALEAIKRNEALERKWVTTYQTMSRELLSRMGVQGAKEHIIADPFYVAIESKIGWESFILADSCLRRLLVLAVEADFTPYESWFESDDDKFRCPRQETSPIRALPVTFIRNRYQSARACATELLYYGRARIRDYERALQRQIYDPQAELVLLDPDANFPEACALN